jgi:enediyne core biosynthesis thioesterase
MRTYFEYRHFVTLADTNLVGNVYFTNYLAWQGACRELFLAQHAPSVVSRLTQDIALVTTSCSCEFFSELYAMDQVSVRMTLDSVVDNRITMNFNYYRLNLDPAQLVARGAQTIACMTRQAGQLTPTDIPDELTNALSGYVDSSMPVSLTQY